MVSWMYLLGGLSGLAAARLARNSGLVNTMVFTHLPSNVLLMLVPLMPSLWSAAAMLFARSCISQMDIPTRQAYTMAVVEPDERSAASGVTTVARSLGASLSPLLVGPMLANPAPLGLPFFLAGGIKIVYDLLLYLQLVKVPERRKISAAGYGFIIRSPTCGSLVLHAMTATIASALKATGIVRTSSRAKSPGEADCICIPPYAPAASFRSGGGAGIWNRDEQQIRLRDAFLVGVQQLLPQEQAAVQFAGLCIRRGRRT